MHVILNDYWPMIATLVESALSHSMPQACHKLPRSSSGHWTEGHWSDLTMKVGLEAAWQPGPSLVHDRYCNPQVYYFAAILKIWDKSALGMGSPDIGVQFVYKFVIQKSQIYFIKRQYREFIYTHSWNKYPVTLYLRMMIANNICEKSTGHAVEEHVNITLLSSYSS